MNTNSQKSIKRNREKTPRGNFFTLLPLLAISCLFFIVLLTDKGLAFPPPAAEYYGTVVNKLGASFPAGTNVSFYDADGVLCGQYNVTSTGYYGFLSCNGDDPDTAVDEGADEGDALSFLINNETAGTLNDSVWSSGTFKRVDLFINRPPVLDSIGNHNATEDAVFYLDINASDPDNDTLQYSLIVSPAFASLTLNSSTGVINTTPDNDDVGVYYVRIIVSDGSLSDYEDIQLRVLNTNDAPYFLQNLTNQTVYEGNATNYDINCSDDDIDYGDSISYSLNVSKITISSSSGLITWTPLHNDTGLYTINATCSDGESTSSQTFNIEVVDINNAPVLTGIGDQSVYSDAILTFSIYAEDADYDTLTYSSNHTGLSISKISNTQATATFSGIAYGIGNYTAEIFVSDGTINDSEVILLRVIRAPYCGDNLCAAGETCSSCAVDCGECPSGGGEGEGSGSAGGGSGATSGIGTSESDAAVSIPSIQDLISSQAQAQYYCVEDWLCSPWLSCRPLQWTGATARGVQERVCRDLNNCGSMNNQPFALRDCAYEPPSSCTDKKRDQGETGIDCGGPCEPCTLVKYAGLVFERPSPIFLPSYLREFPWALLILILVVNFFTTSYDWGRIHKIRKQPFEIFLEMMREYAPFRRKLYKFLTNFDSLGALTITYLYFVGSLYTVNVWVLGAAILATPFLVGLAFKQLEYNEYRKLTKERRLNEMHNHELEYFMRQEQEIISELYGKAMKIVEQLQAKKGSMEPDSEAQVKSIMPLMEKLNALNALSARIAGYYPDAKFESNAKQFVFDPYFSKFAKEYPEPHFAVLSAMKILKNMNNRKADIEDEKEFMAICRDIARDRHLLSVIMAREELVKPYNNLSDSYHLLKKSHLAQNELQKSMAEEEKEYLALLDSISKDRTAIEQISKNKKTALLYNDLILIYNSIKKRQALGKGLK